MTPYLPNVKPIPIKERSSVVFLGRGELDVIDGAFVLVDKINGIGAFPVPRSIIFLILARIVIKFARRTESSEKLNHSVFCTIFISL